MTLHELDSFADMMAEQKLKVTGVRMPKEEMNEFVESCRKVASVPDNLFLEIKEYRGIQVSWSATDKVTYEIQKA